MKCINVLAKRKGRATSKTKRAGTHARKSSTRWFCLFTPEKVKSCIVNFYIIDGMRIPFSKIKQGLSPKRKRDLLMIQSEVISTRSF